MESIRPWAVGAQAQGNFYNLENFVGCRDCAMSCGRTTTHLPEASENKPTDWHQICRRSGRSVSDLLVCRIPFLCRCVYSCLSCVMYDDVMFYRWAQSSLLHFLFNYIRGYTNSVTLPKRRIATHEVHDWHSAAKQSSNVSYIVI